MFEYFKENLKKLYQWLLAQKQKITRKQVISVLVGICVITGIAVSVYNWPLIAASYATNMPLFTAAVSQYAASALELLATEAFWDTLLSVVLLGLYMGYMGLLLYSVISDVQAKNAPKYTKSGTNKGSWFGIKKLLGLQPAPVKKSTKLEDVLKALKEKVGGYEDLLTELLEGIFFDRENNPNKGVILYGPPGTGKTTIAHAIADYFGGDNVQLVRGPELLSKWLGDSPQNVRNLFAPALAAKNKGLFIIVIDEIDALFSHKIDEHGPGAGSHTHNEMVTQMQTMLDGDLKNVLIIGTTNRLFAMDNALTRSGRLGLQILVPLPGVVDRQAILKKQFEPITDSVINYQKWADKTEGFSCADLELVAAQARNKALLANQADRSKVDLMATTATKKCEISEATINAVITRMQQDKEKLARKPKPETNTNAFFPDNRSNVNNWLAALAGLSAVRPATLPGLNVAESRD